MRNIVLLYFEFPIECNDPHPYILAVARRNVRKKAGHLPGSHACIRLERFIEKHSSAGLRVPAAEAFFNENFAGSEIEFVHCHAAIEIGRAARRTIDFAVLHKYGAVYRPDRLDLFVGNQIQLLRRSTKPPGKHTIGIPQCVDPSVTASENDETAGRGRGRIDSARRRVSPDGVTIPGVESMERVFVDRRNKQPTVGHNRLRELTSQLRSPRGLQAGRYRHRSRAAPRCIGSVRRPVSSIAGLWRLVLYLVEGGALLEARNVRWFSNDCSLRCQSIQTG